MKTIGAALLAIGLLAGGTAAATTVPANDPELEALLLTIDDMPTGWAVDTSGNAGTFFADEATADTEPTDECIDEFNPLDGAPHAEVAFAGDTMFDLLGQGIARTDQASQIVAQFADLLERCPTSTDDNGVTSTFGAMSFPELGDATIGIRATNDSFPIPVAVVIIAEDDVLVMLSGVGEGADGELLETLARTALDRID